MRTVSRERKTKNYIDFIFKLSYKINNKLVDHQFRLHCQQTLNSRALYQGLLKFASIPARNIAIRFGGIEYFYYKIRDVLNYIAIEK